MWSFLKRLWLGRPPDPDRSRRWLDLVVLGEQLLVVMLVIGVAMAGSAAFAPWLRSYVAAVGIGLLIFLTALLVGAALGFIFALPKAMPTVPVGATPSPSPLPANGGGEGKIAPPAAPDGPKRRRYLETNGSLERISDWLTTMIIGISLTQLYSLNGALLRFRQFIAETALVFPSAQGPTAGILPAISPFLLIGGAVCGFLFLYLYTRLLLSPLFNETERDLDGDTPLSERQAKEIELATLHTDQARSEFVLGQADRRAPAISVRNAIQRMFLALYKDPPQGFNEVLEIGGALSGTAALNDADYWYYLAAAFGQQYKYIQTQSDRPDEPPEERQRRLMSARDNALDAARRTINLDPSYLMRLRLLLSDTSADDDLSAFANDPDFKALLQQR